MICSKCGTANKDSAKFCKSCGSPLESIPIEKTKVVSDNSSSTGDNKKLILICGTIIVCIIIIAAAFVMISNNNNVASDSNSNSNTDTLSSDSSNSNAKTISSDSSQSSDISIKFCDFYTGSSSTDKSYCSANIGTEHYGEKYKISVLYSDNGENLNDGATATKTVDEDGFLHIYTSNAFSVYPDKAIVTIYDAKGKFLTEETYYLEETSGQQKFGH